MLFVSVCRCMSSGKSCRFNEGSGFPLVASRMVVYPAALDLGRTSGLSSVRALDRLDRGECRVVEISLRGRPDLN